MRAWIVSGLMLAASPLAYAHEGAEGWCFRFADVGPDANMFATVESAEAGEMTLVFLDTFGLEDRFGLKAVGVNEYALQDSPASAGVIFRADGAMEMYDPTGPVGVGAQSAEEDCTGQDQ